MGQMSQNKINFNKTTLANLSPMAKQTYYWDSKTEGLGVGITPKGIKTFVLYRRVNHKPTRIKLGRFPTMSVEKARIKAIKLLDEINDGNDPREIERVKELKNITLNMVYQDYYAARPNLSPNTIKNYDKFKKLSFSDWVEQPLTNITESMVQERYQRDGKTSKVRASQAMRVLRALFNFARENYKDSKNEPLFPHNPVEILSKLKSWYYIKRRTSVIKEHQLKSFFWGALEIKNENIEPNTCRDYILMCLFSGLRANEVTTLQINQIDLEEKSILLDGSTVKNNQDHHIPLNSFTYELIKWRTEQAINRMQLIKNNEPNTNDPGYLFPSFGKKGYFSQPRFACKLVTEKTKIDFTSHDLRRTFITVAESLDISPYAWKMLVNHKIPQNDVSGGYVIPDLNRLRNASQKICDFILEKAEFDLSGQSLWA